MRLSRLAFAAGLALAVSGCNDAAETADAGTAPIDGEPIAAIPAPEGTSWVDTGSKTAEGGFLLGNPDAPLKLVEYASHTCGACANFSANGAAPLTEDYVSTGRVSYEIRTLLRDPLDVTIDVLAQCGAPESFHALSDQAWAALPTFGEALQNNGAAYEAAMNAAPEQRFVTLAQAAGLIDFFAARGLSEDQARQCLSDTAKIQQIADTSQRSADGDQVTGTPTFFLNGRRLDENTWPALEPILQQAGAR